MNIDMNQYSIFRHALTKVKKCQQMSCCARVACSPFVLTEHISCWLAKRNERDNSRSR